MKHLSENIKDILSNHFELNSESVDSLTTLSNLLLKWNKKHNLISKDDENIIWERHILDSLEIYSYLKTQNVSTVLDMGSGMGFPLIPNKICLPNIHFTSIEPREKRVRILKQLKRELKLVNIDFKIGKAEDFVSRETLEQFDIVTCRALGSLSEDWERAQSFLKKGGKFLTLKSNSEFETFSTTPWEFVEYNHLDKEDPYYLVVREK